MNEQQEPEQEPKGEHKTKQELTQEHREFAKVIAERLQETAPPVLFRIFLIVKTLGREKTLALLQETVTLEEQGGLLVKDGSRRRTIGGVFFYLVKEQYWQVMPAAFWPEKKPGNPSAEDAPKSAGSQPKKRMVWEDRFEGIKDIEQEKGHATVKITLVGRPGKVVDRGSCMMLSMVTTKTPSLPSGLPTPADAGTTPYIVYISTKQWKKVASVLEDKEDTLILEGYPQLDAQTKSIAVFVTSAKTKKTEQARQVKTETPS